MEDAIAELTARIEAAESSSRRWRRCATGLIAATLAMTLVGAVTQDPDDQIVDRVRTRRIEVTDSEGRVRVSIGEDKTEGRKFIATGILLFDEKGSERGGLTTANDGSAILALDAPVGVGSPMRDRLGLIVNRDGSSEVRLIANDTLIPVRLVSPAKGSGGIEFLRHLPGAKVISIKKLGFDGESTRDLPLTGDK